MHRSLNESSIFRSPSGSFKWGEREVARPYYFSLLELLPAQVHFSSRITDVTDIVHVFSTRRAELQGMLSRYRQKLKPTGMVWASWRKKAAKASTDIAEDTIREIAFPLGFVDIKVCAIDDLRSGLKLVIRKELR
jgi:hypothetical protein